jgi:formiminotetrahydrofolate cyclodeaminase
MERCPLVNRLLDARLSELIERVSDESVVPGGGATAATTVALAAGLLAMTARRSRAVWEEAGGAIGQAEALKDRAAWLVEESADAYERAAETLGGAHPTGSDPGARDWGLTVVLGRAAEVPLALAEVATDAGELAAEVAERCDPAVRGDAVAACLLAESGVRIGAHLVEINLMTTTGDTRLERTHALIGRAQRSHERALAAATF